MKQELLFVWHILTFNAIKPLPCSSQFFNNHFRDSRNYLKLLYIFSSLISSSYWILTCVFLAAFENIIF